MNPAIGTIVGKDLLAREATISVGDVGERRQDGGHLGCGRIAGNGLARGVEIAPLNDSRNVAIGVVDVLGDQPTRPARDGVSIERVLEPVGLVVRVSGGPIEAGIGCQCHAAEAPDDRRGRRADTVGELRALDHVASRVVLELRHPAQGVPFQNTTSVLVVRMGGDAIPCGVRSDGGLDLGVGQRGGFEVDFGDLRGKP